MTNKILIWLIWGISTCCFLSVFGLMGIFAFAAADSPASPAEKSFMAVFRVVLFIVVPAIQLLSIIPALYILKHKAAVWSYFFIFLPHVLALLLFIAGIYISDGISERERSKTHTSLSE